MADEVYLYKFIHNFGCLNFDERIRRFLIAYKLSSDLFYEIVESDVGCSSV